MSTITVTTKHSPLAFLLYMTKINLTVDGETRQVGWGTETLTVEPGDHEIGVSFRYFGRDVGAANTTVTTTDGGSATVAYKAPWVMTSKGKISVG
ncbi:MAG: hypothetical protein AAGA90_01505 [Actinomycetota bacterium]